MEHSTVAGCVYTVIIPIDSYHMFTVWFSE